MTTNVVNARARFGDWMQTYTGRQFWPLDPRFNEIDIRDIAHALAHQCRYAGHVRTFYSVAQHSVLVSLQASEENALCALLHDATEAYLVDLPRPVKKFMPEYAKAELNLWHAIAMKFDLPMEIPDEVHELDNRILHDEREQLMSEPPAQWSVPGERLGINIYPWEAAFAKSRFMARFHELTEHTLKVVK